MYTQFKVRKVNDDCFEILDAICPEKAAAEFANNQEREFDGHVYVVDETTNHVYHFFVQIREVRQATVYEIKDEKTYIVPRY